MTMRGTVTGWLQVILGPEKFEHRDDGIYSFELDTKTEVSLFIPDSGGAIHFQAPLVATPEEGREAFFATLLRLNLPGGGSDGASLALDESGYRVVLCYSTPVAHLDEESFASIFSNFIDTAEGLMAKLRVLVDESDRPSAPELPQHVIKG